MYSEIAEIYQYAQLVPAIKEIIKYCYTEEDFHVRTNWEELKNLVVDFCKKVAEKDVALAKEIYDRIAQACSYTTGENSNYILMGDEIQETLPLIYQGMALVGEINVLEDKKEFFSTKSGFLSYRNTENQKVYHSTLDPMWEAYDLANRICDSRFLAYCFLGCGLVYLPWQVFCRSDCSADIYIFHTDEKYVNQAMDYGVLEWIPHEKPHIIIEQNVQLLIQKFLIMEVVQGKFGKHVLEDVLEQLKPEEKIV